MTYVDEYMLRSLWHEAEAEIAAQRLLIAALRAEIHNLKECA